MAGTDPFGGFFDELDELREDKPPQKKRPKRSPAEAPRVMTPGRRAKAKKTTEARKKSQDPVIAHLPADEAVEQFVDSLEDTEGTIYIGIDPGMTGGIGLLHPEDSTLSTCVDIPTTKVEMAKSTKTKKAFRSRYDVAGMWHLVRMLKPFNGRVRVYLEEGSPRPTDTSVTAFTVGKSQGIWLAFLYSHGFTLELLPPQKWKKLIWPSGHTKKEKEDGRLKAVSIFPGAPLHRKKDHNRAEAMLIAEAGRILHQGSTNV